MPHLRSSSLKMGVKGLSRDTRTDNIEENFRRIGFPAIYVKVIPPRGFCLWSKLTYKPTAHLM